MSSLENRRRVPPSAVERWSTPNTSGHSQFPRLSPSNEIASNQVTLSTVVVLATTAVILVALVNQRLSRSTEAVEAAPIPAAVRLANREVLIHFRDMAALCQASYNHRLAAIGAQPLDQHGWKFVNVVANGTFWLWSKDGTHAVVCRGTENLHEAVADFQLLQDSVGEQGRTQWTRNAREMLRIARTLLVGVEGPVIFTGHSLGAAYVEYIYSVLRVGLSDSFAITFDSPGQPARFRRQHDMPSPLPGLTTLQAIPNPINTLNPPCAEHLYACGTGSNIPLAEIRRLSYQFLTTTKLSWLWATWDWSRGNLSNHRLRQMQRFIDSSRLVYEDPATWPLYTAHCCGFFFKTRPLPPTPRGRHRPVPPPVVEEPEVVLQAGHMAQLTPLPATLAEVVGNNANQRRPYLIDLINDAGAWNRFANEFLTDDDVLIALVGWSSSGKTSIFKALLGLHFEDSQLPILPSVNTTVLPVVAWMKTVEVNDTRSTRVFVVDLPGAGAEGQAVTTGGSRFVLNSAAALLTHIREKVGCVFFVQKDAALDDQQKAYYETFRNSGIHMRVVYNASATIPADVEVGVNSLNRELRPSEPLVVCHAATSHIYNEADRARLGYDVSALIAMWKQQTTPATLARPGMATGEIPKAPPAQMGFFPNAKDVIAPAVASFAAWVPGVAWYGAYAGATLCTTSIGVVAAGPAAGVLAVSGVVYGGRRLYNNWYRRQ